MGTLEHSPIIPWDRGGCGCWEWVLGPAYALFLSQMKMLDSENARLGRELGELQGRLALGERAEKEGRREALGLRQKLLKGEASLEALRQEVTRWVGRLEGEGPGDSCCSVPLFSLPPGRSRLGLQCWSHPKRPVPSTCPCPLFPENLPQL